MSLYTEKRQGIESAKKHSRRITVASDSSIGFALGECSLGFILVAMSARGICAISLGDDPEALAYELKKLFPQAELSKNNEELLEEVIHFVEAPASRFDLPLDIRGTAFQQRVWQALREISPGSTASYSELAKRIGIPKSVRAVAAACAANKLAVVIPCHRAIRNDGTLCGYRWGIERKRMLLDREAGQ